MLTAAALIVLVGWVALVGAVVGAVLDRVDRRRMGRVAAQARVTDAVHRTLGAIVAPTVVGHGREPWTVTMGLAPRDFGVAGRLTEIAHDALGRGTAGVRVVFIPRTGQ
jgi:phenylpyruvate tautomerase PptA (4-oxalocrotonate tautomerase family)